MCARGAGNHFYGSPSGRYLALHYKDISRCWPRTVHEAWMNDDYTPRLVSVILPTFNRSKLIVRALESVRLQTYRPLEIIVVDDGSTDCTLEAVQGWVREQDMGNSLTVHCVQQPNRGAPSARNLGLLVSRGQFIQFLDSDDLLHPEKIRIQCGRLDEECADFAWSPLKVVRTNESTADLNWYLHKAEKSNAEPRSDYIPDCAGIGLYRRELCRRIGPWDETLTSRQDWDYRYRREALALKTCYVSDPYYCAIIHDEYRVNDHYLTQSDVISMLKALRNAQGYAQVTSHDFHLYGRFLMALRLALLLNEPEAIWQAFVGVISEGHSPYSRRSAILLRVLYRLAGSRLTLRALSTYGAVAKTLQRNY
jgi:glycosyltransferase involved in cell wall biosynthesis